MQRTDVIGEREILGRRVFVDDISKDFDGKDASKVRLDAFVDTRLEDDLSLDRLGKSNAVDHRVKRYLVKQIDATSRESLHGWACFRSKSMTKIGLMLFASPTEVPFSNPYHAHLSRDNHRDRLKMLQLAHILRDIAGEMPYESSMKSEKPVSAWRKALGAIRKFFSGESG